MVVANLPYVKVSEWEDLPTGIRLHEPEQALLGGEDGLDIIRRLLEDLSNHLLPNGAVMLEHGPDQGSIVRHLLGKMACFTDIETHLDLAGRDRCTVGLGYHT